MAVIGVAALTSPVGKASRTSTTAPMPPNAEPPPGFPGSRWLLLAPDTNKPDTPVVVAAVDATGITRALAVAKKLTIVFETTRSTYAISIEFEPAGDPNDVLLNVLSGVLRDLRDRNALNIAAIRITDSSAANEGNFVVVPSAPGGARRPAAAPPVLPPKNVH